MLWGKWAQVRLTEQQISVQLHSRKCSSLMADGETEARVLHLRPQSWSGGPGPRLQADGALSLHVAPHRGNTVTSSFPGILRKMDCFTCRFSR